MKGYLLSSAAVLALTLAAPAVRAQATSDQTTPDQATPDQAAASQPGGTASDPGSKPSIVVTAEKLDAARASIQPALGATRYTISNATIQALPGGDNQQFNQIILQLPGVVQDGFGQFHVRDDHNNLQYRINGTILPEGLAVFGQTLSPRLIDSFSLLTGALPAQYGLRTAGIIDVTTKTGFDNSGQISLYGGSHGTYEPSVEYGGSTGSTNYFVSADYRRDKLGIESVDGSSTPIHDTTKQVQLFGYVDHIIDDENRVSFVGGFSNQAFQIPNPDGLHAEDTNPGWNVGGQTDFLSNDLRERQLERTGFGQLAFLHDSGPLSIQGSVFARYSSLKYTPDELGELLFNGQAQNAFKKDITEGAQIDGAYRLSDAHTLRFGALFEHDRGISDTSTAVFPIAADGSYGQPVTIVDNSAKTETTESVYLQDEWKVLPTVTINLGGRFDHYKGYREQQQFSPRANIVWQPTSGTTIHLGYARYFSPAPFENVATTAVSKFANTSAAAPEGLADTTPFAERQNYFDIGFQQKVGNTGLSFGADAYYRQSHDLIDEGQFGAPIILTPFNYRRGRIHGVEANFSYTKGPWLAYGNFAYAKAMGKDVTSSQFDFDPDDLAYIQNHYIYLDHDQTFTGSGGISYGFMTGPLTGLRIGGDMIYGSGLRADGDVPNGVALANYAQFNLSTSYDFKGPGIQVRFDVINVGNKKYEIRDGTGVGVGAPEYGPRRGFFVGLSKEI